jgi:hypothetical protein
MAQIIELGGKSYRAIEVSTVEHDFTVMQLLVETGLDKVSKAEGESADDFAIRVLRTVMASGKSFDLLGAFLIPADIPDLDWTTELGVVTRQFVSRIADPAEKLLVRNALVTMLLSFSEAGLFSWTDSRESSSEEEAAVRLQTTTSEKPSGPGANSSAPSPVIRPGTWRWLGAHCKRLFWRTRTGSVKAPATITK